MITSSVNITDVGPRDGLQNEKQPVSSAHKIELVHRLQSAGLRRIEVTSFVSPKWVPQMADNQAVMAGIERRDDIAYSVLTPNLKGMESALASRPHEVVVFGAASESFSRRNINCSIDESIERFAPVVEMAHAHGIRVKGSISCALGCPYEGDVKPSQVEHVARRFAEIGVDHASVCDTIGVGTAHRVQRAMEAALKHYPIHEVSGHFHDTYGQALANIYACLEMDVHQFDASVAGLGGCPYAKGATGNVATEDVVFMLAGLGIDTGISLDALIDTAAFISDVLGRKPVSRTGNALLAKRAAAVEAAA